MALFRRVTRRQGSPSINVRCKPITGWDKNPAKEIRGNSHLRWQIRDDELRLATNMPLTYLCEETPFVLEEPLYFALTWGLGLEDDLVKVAHSFLDQTIDYWQMWVKHCSIPTLFQKETIRSALALKLHCYEDTGAILAALTTSLPEECGNHRNWDYRFCWLRDAYFVLSAFRNLGHFEEMEGFLKFLLGIAHHQEHSKERLAPVYALDQSLPIGETVHHNWLGYRNSGPVRSMNQAAEHVQNDVYGEMVLTLAPIFMDERFYHLRTQAHEDLLGHLATLCAKNISKPDAGLWEIRNGWQEHSFSNLMCWAGLERVQRMRQMGYLSNLSLDIESALTKGKASIEAAVKEGFLRNGPKDPTVDAALLQLPLLRFPDAQLNRNTISAVAQELEADSTSPGFLFRYKRQDDFGTPKSAFVVCTFWLVQAYAAVGKAELANQVMKAAMSSANNLGLLSEHFLPSQKLQCGNFPQAYSHVGLINAAFAISPPWEHVL